MEISLKDTLRELRHTKNVTQETLAKHLGITAQAVGKWERGEGFPDITLLPDIALFFGVSIDELLNVGKAQIEQRIKAIQDESLKLKNLGENEKNITLWENAYKEFPNDCRVMYGLMDAIARDTTYPYPKELCDRKIALGERILAESNDSRLRESATSQLCYTYYSMRDAENALKYADMCGSHYNSREGLRAFVLDGEEGVEATQKYLISLILKAVLAASDMTNKVDCTDEERLLALDFGISLWKLLFPDGRVGFYANDLSMRYELKAVVYARAKDKEKTLEALAQSVKYAVEASKLTEKYAYTAPMVNRVVCDPTKSVKNYRGNACDLRLEDLNRGIYDFLRGEPEFIALISELEHFGELSEQKI